MPNGVDLPDVNLWLALAVADHPHHDRASRYWQAEAQDFVAFCRTTSLGLLRLTTNGTVMGGRPLSTEDAWNLYQAFRQLDEVVMAAEPADACDTVLGESVGAGVVTSRLWTDAYLAALAKAAGWRLVTFDADFRRFDGLQLLELDG